jgi:hypothetical protein
LAQSQSQAETRDGLYQYPEGTLVKIAPRQDQEQFRDTWRFHHKLEAEQLSYAGQAARVSWVGYYHGGDVLYRLENVPGTWHQSCLHLACSKNGAPEQ